MFGSRVVGFSWTADRMALFLFRTNPRWQPTPSWKNFKWPYLFSKVEFTGLTDRVDLLPVEPNPRGGRTSSWKISTEYRPISGMRYLIHFHESSFAGIREKIVHEE